jgi:hypothetical protein
VVPSVASLKVDVLTPGWQVWHAFDGFGAPLAYDVPPITHAPPASDPLLDPESPPLPEPESDPLLDPESLPPSEPDSAPLLDAEPSAVESPTAPSPPSSRSGTSGNPTRLAHAGTATRAAASSTRR